MSTLEAIAIVAAVLVFSVPAAYWQIRRAQRFDADPNNITDAFAREGVDAMAAADPTRDFRPPAAPDNVAPVRLDWADECELILGATNDQTATFGADCDRFLAAIYDDQNMEETGDA